jgi:hypothetical protein
VTIQTAYFAESPREFHRHHQELREEYRPRTFSEEYVIRDYAEAIWKLERIKRIENIGVQVCLHEGGPIHAGNVPRLMGDMVYNKASTYHTLPENEARKIRDEQYSQGEERETEAEREVLAKGETPHEIQAKLINLFSMWEAVHRTEAHQRRVVRDLAEKISQLFPRSKPSKGFAGRDSHCSDDGRHSD